MPGVLLGPLGAAVCWCGFVTTALVRVGDEADVDGDTTRAGAPESPLAAS